MDLRTIKTRQDRLHALGTELHIDLSVLEKTESDAEEDIHCENLVGAVSIPLGVAGPLLVTGEAAADGEYYIPLATTEGALVASVNRGCKAVREAGGVHVFANNVGVTRGPVFAVTTLDEQKKLTQWLTNHESELAHIAERTSKHLTFKKMMVSCLANYVFIRFYFDTDQAMGMNMATIATQQIIEHIEKETKAKCLSVAGNFDIDKKPAWLNMINNRGMKAWAECIIPAPVLQNTLKVSAERLFDVWLAKCMLGSAMSGSLGFNAHFANIIAAFYAATGQDIAHVVEGSMGITTAKVIHNNDLYFSVYLPALMLGSIGGGTGLKTQTAARSITGVHSSLGLSEVLAGAVLAGELSLLASLTEGTLSKAHTSLGR